jgi:hypothetical protein
MGQKPFIASLGSVTFGLADHEIADGKTTEWAERPAVTMLAKSIFVSAHHVFFIENPTVLGYTISERCLDVDPARRSPATAGLYLIARAKTARDARVHRTHNRGT